MDGVGDPIDKYNDILLQAFGAVREASDVAEAVHPLHRCTTVTRSPMPHLDTRHLGTSTLVLSVEEVVSFGRGFGVRGSGFGVRGSGALKGLR